MRPRRVLVDFDGVLAQRGKGRDPRPVEGAIQAMRQLRANGYEVVVFTTRATNGGSGVGDVEAWLEHHKIRHDGVTGEKLDAQYYIDDKAIPFRDWAQTTKEIMR